jgi:cation:H+ antiporter
LSLLDELLRIDAWGVAALVAAVIGSALIILIFGTLLTREADRLADRTGLGEAIFGAVALGAATSLSGSVMSVVVANQGYPELAASNAVGGIVVQTAFLVVADMTYRRANLEHAAASLENLLLGAMLCAMLAAPLVGAASPAGTVFGIHPVTPILFAGYVYGLRVVKAARGSPLWQAMRTTETRDDVPDTETRTTTRMLWWRFAGLVVVTGAAGLLVARTGVGLVEEAGLRQSVVGAFVTATVTSLPELVVTISAVGRGTLPLAVGGIIGGNSFDVLFLAFSDIAYRDGSIYHAMGQGTLFLTAVGIVMTGILLMGLLRREKGGIGGIGFESFAILLLYVAAVLVLAVGL